LIAFKEIRAASKISRYPGIEQALSLHYMPVESQESAKSYKGPTMQLIFFSTD